MNRDQAQGKLTAYAIIRAAIVQDADAGVLLINNAAAIPDHLDPNLAQLCIDMAFASARALLSASGYDMRLTLRQIDSWIDEASRALAAAEGKAAL
jgi:hypothetical protein